ncbi:MAG TPA: DNA-protecting protein DprA [Spirochaetia bacterium]|nr:MAG: DNA protecting protein DprA [Spirochaetes bacterium GWB1_36_13]HCL56697.1 DNA-protecting protein DprA [Spirochaetia bacterium]
MKEENLRKALYLKFYPRIGNRKTKEIIEKSLWDTVDLNQKEAKEKTDAELEKISRLKVSTVTLFDENYPSLLKEIYDPPIVLYYYGSLETALPLGVVGTRKPSRYGVKAVRKLVGDLVCQGVEIVSGLAYGIDTEAHYETLENKGKTLAVMGSGIDITYPSSNQRLRDLILQEGGAVVSEFPIGTKPAPFTFPMRNRIISGLSLGVLVGEAGENSGAIITAKNANDQGRQVFAIPGMIETESFTGNHALIRQGAALVRNAGDILDEISFYRQNKLETKETVKSQPKNLILSEEENLVLSLLKEPVSIDELIQTTGMSVPKILSLLTQLSLKDAVEERGGVYNKK